MDVSRETSERLDMFAALVLKWTRVINLISKVSEADIRERHIRDSFQIYDLAGEGSHWVDMGSGGGFPGMVVAIIAAEKHPERHVTLLESDQRKATFLREAARATGIQATVISERIEAASPLNADIISARALAPLPLLLDYSQRHRKAEGVSIFPKGAQHQQEIAEARGTWHFDPVIHPSATDPSGVILEVRSLSRA